MIIVIIKLIENKVLVLKSIVDNESNIKISYEYNFLTLYFSYILTRNSISLTDFAI